MSFSRAKEKRDMREGQYLVTTLRHLSMRQQIHVNPPLTR